MLIKSADFEETNYARNHDRSGKYRLEPIIIGTEIIVEQIRTL